VYLIWVDICPSGIKEAKLYIGESSPYIYNVLPDDRVSELKSNDDGQSYISLTNEPVYFSVLLPNTQFDEVEVELEYNSNEQPLIELGALTDIYSENYSFKPIYNKIIETLDWQRIVSDDVSLFQRKLNFNSIENFLSFFSDRSKIGTYQYDLSVPYIEDDYKPITGTQTINVSLRGYHKYLTYIKNEPFYLSVDYMDMNRTAGADDAVIRVRDKNDNVVFEYFINDDGDIIEDQVRSNGTAIIDQNGWEEGVYSVELSGTSDIFWRSITTSQKYMTFVSKIYIADDVGYLESNRATEFYTDAKHIVFETTHEDAVQKITIGNDVVDVSQSHVKYNYTVDSSGVVRVYSPLSDIKIVGDGKFAFKSSMYFNPDPIQLNAYSDIDALGIDYIITTYKEYNGLGDWSVASAKFSIDDLAKIDNTVKFAISAPGLTQFNGDVDLQSITVRFLKEKMTFKEIYSAVRNLLPFGL
jgi:hypothetical protein